MDEPHDVLDRRPVDGDRGAAGQLDPRRRAVPAGDRVAARPAADHCRRSRTTSTSPTASGTLFMLTMHPHITGQRSRMKYLEELIVYMKSKPGVWFATAEEIARYVKTQSGLAGTASDSDRMRRQRLPACALATAWRRDRRRRSADKAATISPAARCTEARAGSASRRRPRRPEADAKILAERRARGRVPHVLRQQHREPSGARRLGRRRADRRRVRCDARGCHACSTSSIATTCPRPSSLRRPRRSSIPE